MVTKLTLPSKENAVQEKVNEIIDNLGGGYSAGTGIDISNNTISVDNTVAMKTDIPAPVTETTVSGWGFTKNVGTVTSVNNTSPDSNGNVTLSIPAAQVNSDWNAVSGVAQILNKPSLATVATTGAYSDLTGQPTIPTVNNATLTITQGGTTKGTFTANASSNVTIDLDSGGSVDIDNTTITENSDNELQTVAVIDNRSGNAIKTWTGTKAQYDAIVSKDSNTLYNVTDDVDISLPILEVLYPVGSIYITTANTCPLVSLISGSTWELVSSGRVLQGADSGHSAGTTIEAGLPNIMGSIGGGYNWVFNDGTGALKSASKGTTNNVGIGGSDNINNGMDFNASLSNSIYGNSTTVQPPAYFVNIYRRLS